MNDGNYNYTLISSLNMLMSVGDLYAKRLKEDMQNDNIMNTVSKDNMELLIKTIELAVARTNKLVHDLYENEKGVC